MSSSRPHHDPKVATFELQFLGGPLDGHSEAFPSPLPTSVCFRSNATLRRTPWLQRVTRALQGGCPSEPFAVAIYELELVNEELVLFFAGSRVAKQLKGQDEAVWLIADDVLR